MMTNPDIYEYLDYRRFLGDAYQAKRAESRKFSYRYFMRRAGLKSPIYLKLVIDGERNLSERSADGFARAFGLNDEQVCYFQSLVAMNQASTSEERATHFRRLSLPASYRGQRKLERSEFEYYARWYCVPIRELVARADFCEDAAWVAGQLRPSISVREAEEALVLLEELGLLIRGDDGCLQQASPDLTTGDRVRSLAVRRFHQQMLANASASLDAAQPDERFVGGITLRLTKSQVSRLRKQLFVAARELIAEDGQGEGPQMVYHYTQCLFPVSLPEEDDSEGTE